MPTSERRRVPTAGRLRARRNACSKARSQERGFSYLLLLFMVLISGVALAALGENISVAQQREREAELLWRGEQIARALASYRAVPVSGRSRFPEALADLVDDRRLAEPRYHLRRLYLDPFTGEADWALQRDAQGGIVGVYSRSRRPALARLGTPVAPTPEPDAEATATGPAAVVRVGDWLFTAGGAPADVAAASVASAPASAGARRQADAAPRSNR